MGKEKQQLCWTCKKSCGGSSGCSWFNGFKPIPGWLARPTISDTIPCKGKMREIKSFHIIRCPLYEKENFKHSHKTKTQRYIEESAKIGCSLRTYQRYIERMKILERINDCLHK